MQGYIGVLTIALLLGMVLTRAAMLQSRGIEAIHFGNLDRKDFLIPPFALFYFYVLAAAAFALPTPSRQTFFQSEFLAWTGVAFCVAGLALFLWGLGSFGRSFRVGIDVDRPDKLVTTGAFAFTRNPLYVAYALVLVGQFLIFPNWILLLFLGGAAWIFHRQVLREEDFLKKHYGEEYAAYCGRVRRYV